MDAGKQNPPPSQPAPFPDKAASQSQRNETLAAQFPQDATPEAVYDVALPAGTGTLSRPAGDPLLRKLRKDGRDPAAFAEPETRKWFLFGVAGLALIAALPFISPELGGLSQRLATLLSLVFLSGAVGLWLGMGPRSFLVSTTFALILYGLTAWTRFAFPLQDFFVVAVVVSFLIFALAGFNVVFVLEEMVYDAHVRIHLRSRLWNAIPSAFVLGLAIWLPMWNDAGGPALPALWIAAVAGSVLLGGWWFLRIFNHIDDTIVLRELHLFVIGALFVAALADGTTNLADLPSLLPSLIAYMALLGTWMYASYTTLQRTHFLLSGKFAAPWVAILLGASYAILAHAHILFESGGSAALADLADQRINYLVVGVWVGIGFYVVRGLWRIFRYVQAARGVGPRSQNLAGHAARVAGSLAGTELYLHDVAVAMFRRFDDLLPGEHRHPRKPVNWELEPDARLHPFTPKPPNQ